jgi:tetratricopeptide (TPR) repeat protein
MKNAPLQQMKKTPPEVSPEILAEQRKIDGLVHTYQKLLQADPGNAQAWAGLGTVQQRLGRDTAALACFNRALEIFPGNPPLLSRRGVCLAALNRMDESLEAHAEAFRQEPGNFTIRAGYALALRVSARHAEALAHFEILCAQQPDNSDMKMYRAAALLHLARFKEGWEAFECRWKYGKMEERQYDTPRWRGEDLTGKTILVYKEQGFGDTILCARYIPLVKARGGRVIFECQSSLHRLFQSIPGIDRMVGSQQIDEPFDYHVPVMSLPGIFGTDLNSIPPFPELNIPASPPPQAARLLALGKDRFKVGIVWSGSEKHATNRRRSAPFRHFLPLAEIPGVQLYSLQKGPPEKDLLRVGGQGLILELGPHVNDFTDTAAVLRNLDLVIMTDSSVAHLAGAVGCPIWNLLHYHPYWLYLSQREDSPWYPSMRLLRAPKPGDWDGVFEKAAAELKKAVALKKDGQWTNIIKAA